eukprot:m.210599 g.210599  ORF g.210599 m.210599 type:complete len:116 (+) comp15557_c2_seq2:234-581(+)
MRLRGVGVEGRAVAARVRVRSVVLVLSHSFSPLPSPSPHLPVLTSTAIHRAGECRACESNSQGQGARRVGLVLDRLQTAAALCVSCDSRVWMGCRETELPSPFQLSVSLLSPSGP